MKQRLVPLLLCLLLMCALALPALGAADQQDPVIAKSYLDKVATTDLKDAVNGAATRAMNAAYGRKLLALAEAVGDYRLQLAQKDTGNRFADGTVLLLKKGDQLTLAPGTQIMPLSGTMDANCSGVINISAGYALSRGGALYQKNLYMKNDTPQGGVTITSDTAELWLSGVYTLTVSSQTDYGSLATALQTMGLFQGTGSSFSLESASTRAQGLVMFLRIMGLEDEALAYTGTHPFTDVPQSHWAYRYIAYAYDQGLTNGSSAYQMVFSPEAPITAQHYLTMLMRALHYDEGTVFTYSTVLSDCVTQQLFSKAEINALTSGTFRRARLVYLSYYGLYGIDQTSGRTLIQNLIADYTVPLEDFDQAVCEIVGSRIK